MRIFLLSLNNEIGGNRRKKLNYNYEIYEASRNTELSNVDEKIINKMRRNNCNDNLFRIKCSHFDGYYKLLKMIVEEKIDDVIVCEDDAILKDIPNFINIDDEAVLLNAKLHHPKNYKLDKEFNRDEIEFVDGINKIDYSKYRWSCCGCIYYPTYKSAEKIINYIDNCSTQYTYMDLFMAKHKLIKYLQYPSVFKIEDEGISQVNGSKGNIDNFK